MPDCDIVRTGDLSMSFEVRIYLPGYGLTFAVGNICEQTITVTGQLSFVANIVYSIDVATDKFEKPLNVPGCKTANILVID